MGIQSAIMAWQFGTNFQAGKRWISAMDNNTFNKLTPQSLMTDNTNAIREMIPTMQESLSMMTPLVKSVILEFGAMITEAFNTLNPFKDSNGFNFWEPEFDIFKLQKGPFRFGPNPITPVPIGPPTQPKNLIHLDQQQVLQLTTTQLQQAINNDFHLYDASTQQLLQQELQRRNRTAPKKPVPLPIQKVPLAPSVINTLKSMNWDPIHRLILESFWRSKTAAELITKTNTVFGQFQNSQATTCSRNNKSAACLHATKLLSTMLRLLTQRNILLSQGLPFTI